MRASSFGLFGFSSPTNEVNETDEIDQTDSLLISPFPQVPPSSHPVPSGHTPYALLFKVISSALLHRSRLTFHAPEWWGRGRLSVRYLAPPVTSAKAERISVGERVGGGGHSLLSARPDPATTANVRGAHSVTWMRSVRGFRITSGHGPKHKGLPVGGDWSEENGERRGFGD